ncbi:MAG TPA: hypothetical protein PK079_00925 [Leptospiraceae bacterium]|nr:hypothetical protein [Leptospiraceae bacterium]HMX33144.1 hypothetical protein [Leptospiraceae bacterium]HMY29905.1 hypothetical protein [Leptospiraceae bacterium]HMZ62951.1 hypothetical protein [Leptospiraceae bacterium]HNA08279.1 hypothetical protein [Leptospiraceae bacterium]
MKENRIQSIESGRIHRKITPIEEIKTGNNSVSKRLFRKHTN